MTVSSAARRALLVATIAVMAPAMARGNGRFPAAQHVVVGPGAGASSIAVRTTVGLFVSRDEGRSFSWTCEEALSYRSGWDPPLVMSADGALLVGLPDGVSRAGDDCSFARVDSAGADEVVDLAASPDGERVIGVTSGVGAPARVLVSTDRGRTFAAHDPGVGAVQFTTVDFAPSRPSVVWAVGLRGEPIHASLLRSDDGGTSFSVASERLGDAVSAWLSAVDPRDPSRVWVRIPRASATDLTRSDDGGHTWRTVLTIPGPMLGFALAEDGSRVWVGGLAGLWRSDDGDRFTPVATSQVLCLRHQTGALYVCTDLSRDGVGLTRVRDGESVSEALLAYRDVQGPPPCSGDASVASTCAPLWPTVRGFLLRSVRDAGVTAMDATAPTTDASTPVAGDPKRDCGCHSGTPPGSTGGSLIAALASVALRRRRSDIRRRSPRA